MITPRKIQRMKKDELLQLAEKLGCEVPAGALRPELVDICIAKISAEPVAVESPQISREPGDRELFNQLTAGDGQQGGAGESSGGQPEGTHGGARLGAGRKPGKTNDECRLDNLPAEPNRTVKDFYKWLFRIWARVADCKEIELDSDELNELSLDTTHFLEYHGIKIPQGLSVDTRFIISNFEAVGTRIAIHKAHKARQDAKKPEGKDDDKGQ